MLDSNTISGSPLLTSFDFEWTENNRILMGLSNLPYDLLLNIATYLDLHDIHTLHLTCKSLHDFASTRPVYRKLAHDLLGRCRALPLKGFQRLSDLSTDQLIRAVNKASRLEIAWRRRAPRSIRARDACSDIFDDDADGPSDGLSGSRLTTRSRRRHEWYKVVSAPPNEEVDWLSPITSKYTLCATKSGKVVCWDVKTDACLAEWSPSERWELWKCRVEFEQRTVFFTMAKVLQGSYDDDRLMEFVLMKLEFFDSPSGNFSYRPPQFSHISGFRTSGVVMNVFLLDPTKRLLSAFVWLSTFNTIGLYVLLDWEKEEYVFIDTAIEGVMSSNWSCILFEKNIVIHCEENNAAYQHFYPIPLLRRYNRTMHSRMATPCLAGRLLPARTLKKNFVFPKLEAPPVVINQAPAEVAANDPNPGGAFANAILTPAGILLALPPDIAANLNAGLANAEGPVDIAQLITPQQLEQLLTQAPVLFVQNPAGQQGPHVVLPPPLVQANNNNDIPAPTQLGVGDDALHVVVTTTGALPLPPPFTHQVIVNGTHVHDGPDDSDDDDSDDDDDEDSDQDADHDGFPNPFPFPWYPESAHFVRQWWPTLPGVPRVSCTVVLLAGHDQQTHATRFVLAQHYFRVPLDWKTWKESQQMVLCVGKHHNTKGKYESAQQKRGIVNGKLLANGEGRSANGTMNNGRAIPAAERDDDYSGDGTSSTSPTDSHVSADTSSTADSSEDEVECECGWAGEQYDNMKDEDDDDNSMKMWYVSTPFDVVCVSDVDDEDGQPVERPRPLIAVDFGHAVWVEYAEGHPEEGEGSEEEGEDEQQQQQQTAGVCPSATAAGAGKSDEQQQQDRSTNQRGNPEPKCLRFVTFPPYETSSAVGPEGGGKMEGVVRTLKIPNGLELDSVETINIDQSQGAVILSVREGRIFILCYE